MKFAQPYAAVVCKAPCVCASALMLLTHTKRSTGWAQHVRRHTPVVTPTLRKLARTQTPMPPTTLSTIYINRATADISTCPHLQQGTAQICIQIIQPPVALEDILTTRIRRCSWCLARCHSTASSAAHTNCLFESASPGPSRDTTVSFKTTSLLAQCLQSPPAGTLGPTEGGSGAGGGPPSDITRAWLRTAIVQVPVNAGCPSERGRTAGNTDP